MLLLTKKLLSYAIDFVSFFLERADASRIEKIILFGSVAREEADADSDVDLFIETVNNMNIEKSAEKIKSMFFSSMRYRNYWELKGIKNDIKIITGRLDNWKDIKNSIISNGILLYGKYESAPRNAVHKTIFSWEKVKPESRRVLLFKRLFGYKAEKKEYKGLLNQYGGEKLSKGSILVLTKHSIVFMKLFRKMKITVKIRKIIEYI